MINRALEALRREAGNPNRSLYDNNKAVYSLLRYGVPVKAAIGDNTETVWLVDWATPANNDFAIAEEVTLSGQHDRRPDIVLYVNGIAVPARELTVKRAIFDIVSNADAVERLFPIIKQHREY